MAVVIHLFGVAMVLAAATLVHLTTRRQQWRPAALPAVPALGGAVVLTVAATVAWAQVMLTATAVAVTLTMAMLALTVIPLAGLVWSAAGKGGGR